MFKYGLQIYDKYHRQANSQGILQNVGPTGQNYANWSTLYLCNIFLS